MDKNQTHQTYSRFSRKTVFTEGRFGTQEMTQSGKENTKG